MCWCSSPEASERTSALGSPPQRARIDFRVSRLARGAILPGTLKKKRSAPAAHDHDHTEQARELLRAAGLRVTNPRLVVLKALLDNHRPTSAQELIDSTAQADMDEVTVYRTLNTLVEQKIAQPVSTSDRGRRFEVHACAGCRVDHPHAECRRCGSLQCLEAGFAPMIVVASEVEGFKVEGTRLHLYGLCVRCQKSP